MTIALLVAGWFAGWLVAGAVRRLPAAPPGAADLRVSVVIPARNEADRLPRLLAALTADRSGPVPHELVVVDDSSTDGTGALAAEVGAAVVPADPPDGWTGKSWACWQGAQHATGDVVVFLDADTEPAPGFVARLALAADATGGLVSVQPTHRVERTYEHASAVCNTIALMAGTGTTRLRWWRGPVAFGPALAVPRMAYLERGGHGLVRSDVAEDLALARALDRSGLPVAAFADAGEGGIRYRMYPEGPASLIEGWTKNLAAGAGSVPPLRSALVGLWITGALLAVLSVVALPAAYVAYAAQSAVLFRRAGRFGLATALLYPLPLVAFVAFFTRSAVRRIGRRPVTWRGRTVPT